MFVYRIISATRKVTLFVKLSENQFSVGSIVPKEIKHKSTIVDYNRKARIVQNVIYFLDFIVVLFALAYPWISSRSAARKSITNIFTQHLLAHTEAITGSLQEFLRQFEVPSRFLLGVVDDPYLIDCTSDKVYQFIRYCKSSRRNIQPQPNVFFLGQNSDTPSFCFINWNSTDSDNEDDFHFYYMMNPSVEFYMFKHFSGLETDFSIDNVVDDSEQGTIIEDLNFYDRFVSLFASPQYNKFLWENPFTYPPLISKSMLTGAIYTQKTNEYGTTATVSGIGLQFYNLYSTLNSVASITKCNYALLDMEGSVLMTDQGITPFLSSDNQTPSLFPTLRQLNSTFWYSVASIDFDLENKTIMTEVIDDNVYLLLSEYITIRDTPQFQLIVSFNLEESLAEIYFRTCIIFIFALVLLGIIYFALSYFSRRSAIERARKLQRVPTLQDDKFTIDENCGVLLRSIHSLRRLQLAYPEDSMLNKIIDSAVLSLAQSKNALFCKPISSQTSHLSNEFNEAIQHKLIAKEPAKPPFSIWKKTVGKNLIKGMPSPSLDFKWEFYSENPIIIVKQMVALIVQHDLFFSEIDPDGLLNFLTLLAKNTKYPISTSLRVNAFSYLLSQTLKNSLQVRLDILALSLSVALIHSVAEENYCKRIKAINHVLESFDQTVPGTGETRDYLRETIKEILMATDDKHVFDIIGEFSLISESPEFSITDNYDHHRIYMRALVKLCDFCPYWLSKDTMIKALQIENTLGDVSLSFRSNYEYVVASKIVSPLLNDFTNIAKMDDISINFKENLEYLKSSAAVNDY